MHAGPGTGHLLDERVADAKHFLCLLCLASLNLLLVVEVQLVLDCLTLNLSRPLLRRHLLRNLLLVIRHVEASSSTSIPNQPGVNCPGQVFQYE